MSDEEAKMTRRTFVKFSAMSSMAAGGFYAITAKTDALAQEPPAGAIAFLGIGETSSYTYNNGIP